MPGFPELKKEEISNPEFVKNYPLLQEIGVIGHINSLNREIQNYKNLVSGALDVLDSTTIEGIMEASVRQISDRLLPSFVVFLWKPLRNREDITVKSYKNYKLVDLKLKIDNISVYEPIFRKYPHPLEYTIVSSELGNGNSNESLDAIKPAVIIPIFGPQGFYGMVLLGPKILEDKYSDAELVHIRELVSFVSKAIQNHLHYEMSQRDEKTGLYNNGFFLNRLSEEISRQKRTRSAASVIMIDVDGFKNLNDTYGHLAGDRFLESLAITIKQGVRTEDIASRFGGGMFTVLLPNMDKEEAWNVAERLRTMVERMKVQWEPQLPKMTISLGICSLNKDSELSPDKIIGNADAALSISKEMGRNRTTVWGSGLFDKIRRMEAFGTQ